ncbi:MAG: M28 family peptidase [Acidocella sp.]|nr:M28 family peptidase [Acidocella sp.]
MTESSSLISSRFPTYFTFGGIGNRLVARQRSFMPCAKRCVPAYNYLFLVILWLMICCLSNALGCETRPVVNRQELLDCIKPGALWHRLLDFQAIADSHLDFHGHPSRDTGTAGYEASVRYVATQMRRAGYHITIQRYPWLQSVLDGTPYFSAPHLVYRQDWEVAKLSGSGTASGRLAFVAGTGCAISDYHGIMRGTVALIMRGGCSADTQVSLAEAAGAVAVVLADGAHPAPVALTRLAQIPVLIAYANCVPTLPMGARVALAVRLHVEHRIDENVIADSPYGDANHVVVVDAHLDSIYGPGILDNASGSASILETALAFSGTPTRNHLRFIWFGGEELGLLGSAWYTIHLTKEERARLRFDLDADVTATPNFDILVADPRLAPNAVLFPPNVIPQSQVGNRAFINYFHQTGIPAVSAWFGNEGTRAYLPTKTAAKPRQKLTYGADHSGIMTA